MKEVWKDVFLDGEQTGYQVSNTGRIRYSLYKNSKKDGFVKPRPSKNGYLRVCIRLNGKKVERYIHRLVAECFLENEQNKPYVNHIDGDKTNNKVENLEWVTAFENMKHCFDNELCQTAKPVILYTLDGKFFGEFVSVSEALRVVAPQLKSTFGIDAKLLDVDNLEPRQAHGFQWRLRDGDNRPISDIRALCKRQRDKIVQLTLDGAFVKYFDYPTEACRELGVSNNGFINQVCKNKRKSAYGFKWMYYSDYLAKLQEEIV